MIYLNKRYLKAVLQKLYVAQEFTEMLELFCILFVVLVTRLYTCVTIYRTLYSKNVNFSACKLKGKNHHVLSWNYKLGPMVNLTEHSATN